MAEVLESSHQDVGKIGEPVSLAMGQVQQESQPMPQQQTSSQDHKQHHSSKGKQCIRLHYRNKKCWLLLHFIRASVQQQQQQQQQPRPQYQAQPLPPQSQVRPNLNPAPAVVRPHLPAANASQQPTNVPLQRPAPSPLRRVDSRGNIQVNQPQNQPIQQHRPQGPQGQIGQAVRPQQPSTAQNFQQVQQQPVRHQSPGTLSPQQSSNQLQTRPYYPYTNQQPQSQPQPQQNPQARPPQFQRPPGQQQPPGVAYPNQTQFRTPFPQQGQQQRPNPPQPQAVRAMQNPTMPQSPKIGATGFDRPDYLTSNEVNRMNTLNSTLSNNRDPDDDLGGGRITNPLKKPIDPMTQSQYGFLDNSKPLAPLPPTSAIASNGFNKIEDQSKKPPTGGNLTSFTSSTEQRTNHEIGSAAQNSIANLERNDSRNSLLSSPKTTAIGRYDYQNDNNREAANNSKPLMSFAAAETKTAPQNFINDNKDAPPRVAPSPAKPSTDLNRDAGKIIENNAANKNAMGSARGRQIYRMQKGDNDSGVDETTQGHDRNGPNSPGSPMKSPTKNAGSRPASTTPSMKSNISRSASRSRNLKTPEPEPIKKVPMNKIQVGHAPSPNLKAVRSKIGSLDNANYKPGGGNVKIETKKVEIKATPRIEAKNDKYMPKGGDKKIVSTKLQWNAKSKIGSLENAHHKPGGGDKKIETVKAEFKDKAKPKVGSKENAKYVAGGGDIKANDGKSENNIQTHKIEIKAQSKIGSMDNVKHKPGGGDKKIFDDKDYLKNVEHAVAPTTPPTQSPAPGLMSTSVGADENLNQQQS